MVVEVWGKGVCGGFVDIDIDLDGMDCLECVGEL